MHHVCIKNGHLDITHSDCPLTLKDNLSKCWKFNPSDRPCFSNLLNVLQEFTSSTISSDSES